MGYILTGDQQKTVKRRLGEILRQFGQDEYPHNPERALDALQAFSEGRFEVMGSAKKREEPAILRLIPGGEMLVLDPTNGTDIIATATDVFANIDPNFKNWGADEASGSTMATAVAVHELARDATFAQMFCSASADLSRLCLTQSQIKGFTKKHRSWLCTDGNGMFFLFKSNGEVFVASIGFGGDRGEVGAHVARFGSLSVQFAWYRPRLVLPSTFAINRRQG
ncbi:MAG: hypothetical protein Q8L21_01285 [Candidatus Komeilibacteria bacterium]|nr:hypothetical protein [Candidatus Komeilibacteria bacterium]